MGAHTRPPGVHRGAQPPIVDVHVSARRAGAVVGTAAVVAGTAMAFAPSASAANGDDFGRLRVCESGGNYATNTGNGYYGAYQFDVGTWRGLGYSGLPSSASPAVQDQAAQRLQASRGWSPWPACSAKLGLGSGSRVASAAPAAASPDGTHFVTGMVNGSPVPAAPAPPVVRATAPAFAGTTFTTALVNTKRADVAAWQQQMARRGWTIGVDGYFGPQSARVAKQFIVNLKLRTPAVGAVNKLVWDSAYTVPVS